MAASNAPEEKDMTLIDLLECPDIMELGATEENEAKKRVSSIVDELQINAEIKCDDGDVENYLLQFKIGWQKHHTSVMPAQTVQNGTKPNCNPKSNTRAAETMARRRRSSTSANRL